MFHAQGTQTNLVQLTDIWWTLSGASEVCARFISYMLLQLLLLCRLVHAFTAAGILPSQYMKFSDFATLGNVGKWYIQQGIYPTLFIIAALT